MTFLEGIALFMFDLIQFVTVAGVLIACLSVFLTLSGSLDTFDDRY